LMVTRRARLGPAFGGTERSDERDRVRGGIR